jgi:hypothetical protein
MPSSLKKNVASQNITFCQVVSASGAVSTSTTTSAFTILVSVDGTQGAQAGTLTHLGSGQFNYSPSQGETNGANVGIFIQKTSASPVNLDFHTDVVDSNGYPSVNLVDINGTAASSGTAGLGVNVLNFNGTVVTARDIGASVLLSATGQSSLADVILDRDMSLGLDSGSTSVRTLRQATRFLRNKWAISAGTLTVYKEDDTTSSWTATMATDASANPIISSDPAGP